MQKDTRSSILQAARELFQLKGYASTSIADILSRSQANSGSLYYFFPSKQDLLVAVLNEYRNTIREMLLEPAWRHVEDPLEKVFALLAKYRAALVETDCEYGCPIGSLALELHEPDPTVRAAIASNFEAWISAVESCLRQMVGRFRTDVDVRALAELALTVMEGGVMQSRTYRDIRYFDRAVSQYRSYLTSLMKKKAVA